MSHGTGLGQDRYQERDFVIATTEEYVKRFGGTRVINKVSLRAKTSQNKSFAEEYSKLLANFETISLFATKKKDNSWIILTTLFLTKTYLLNTIKPFSGHENQSLGPEQHSLKNP
jgi:hypothetical protein